MKPYGREKKLQGNGPWKKDHHPHPKHLWRNWWETINDCLSRSRMKQLSKREIDKEILEEENYKYGNK
jgi:hypothetical protein